MEYKTLVTAMVHDHCATGSGGSWPDSRRMLEGNIVEGGVASGSEKADLDGVEPETVIRDGPQCTRSSRSGTTVTLATLLVTVKWSLEQIAR